jgi:hypothetical protein
MGKAFAFESRNQFKSLIFGDLATMLTTARLAFRASVCVTVPRMMG